LFAIFIGFVERRGDYTWNDDESGYYINLPQYGRC